MLDSSSMNCVQKKQSPYFPCDLFQLPQKDIAATQYKGLSIKLQNEN